MKALNFILLILLSTSLFLAGCSEQPSVVIEEENIESQIEMTGFEHNNAATITRQTFTVPFPPDPAIDFIPVPAPCLGLGEPLRMSGIWSGWFQVVILSNGGSQFTERIDYSEITLKTDDLTWLAGPSANQTIISSIPADTGESALVIRHEIKARFASQNGHPDLLVSRRFRLGVSADRTVRHSEFESFKAECIGN
jgi:hypothetical protein